MVYGLYMVRNEADIIRTNVHYHLSLGVDRLLVVDNGSTDGTGEALRELSERDSRVRWTRDDGPFLPSRIATTLARQAFREGADWILPIDADEFWHVPGGDLKSVLEDSDAGVLLARVVNFVQRRDQEHSSPEALLYMTRRVASPVGPPGEAQDLVEQRRISFVQKMYPPKCVSRPTAEIEIQTGNHRVSGTDAHRERTEALVCLHAPMRSLAALRERVNSASRAAEAGRNPGQGRNRRRLAGLSESEVEREWAANSYKRNSLDVFGTRHGVVFDSRLRDAVSPLVPQSPGRRLFTALRSGPKKSP